LFSLIAQAIFGVRSYGLGAIPPGSAGRLTGFHTITEPPENMQLRREMPVRRPALPGGLPAKQTLLPVGS